MFQTILFPTDGSDCAEQARNHVAELAMRYGASVHVLTAVDARDGSRGVEQLESEAKSTVVEAASAFDDGIETVTSVRTGTPDEVIRGYADQVGADLITMGTHGRTGVRRFVIGSIAEKVLRLSDVPVLTVTDEAAGRVPYEDVLVPTDGSAGAEAAAQPAAALATACDATVHTVSVMDTSALGTEARSDAVVEALRDEARAALDEFEATLADHGVESATTTVMSGTPYRSIQTYATDNDVDLIVMGTHGRTGLDRYLLGSVTEKLVRTSPVPVLAVRIPEEE